jgi:hypothetical protein
MRRPRNGDGARAPATTRSAFSADIPALVRQGAAALTASFTSIRQCGSFLSLPIATRTANRAATSSAGLMRESPAAKLDL